MKILMIMSEMDGIVKTGGLADFGAALSGELTERGYDVRVAIPRYKDVVLSSPDPVPLYFNLNHYQPYGCLVHPVKLGPIAVRLIEHHDFFSRDGIYGYDNYSYPDNVLRYAFFCKAALEDCLHSQWIPDIVHCNDWQTALAPYYLKEHYPDPGPFGQTRSLLTIHNGEFQGKTDRKWLDAIGIRPDRFTSELMEEYGSLNPLKCGIMYADAINAVSPGYCRELLLPETSHNLWHYLNKRKDHFQGILNGCDYSQWDPETDPFIPHHFSPRDMTGKGLCKTVLQKRMGLAEKKELPLLGLVSRLAAQKGFDYLIPAIERLLYEDTPVQLALLGSGEPEYGSWLHHLQQRYPRKMGFVNGYDNGLSHLIEAGSDFFMMPSLFEPCGLNQLYSLAYGTLPIIRETGGLKDTVVPLGRDDATGICFSSPDTYSCFHGLKQAVSLYNDNRPLYLVVQQRAMGQLFTWQESAEKYGKLYQKLLEEHPSMTGS
ncbi:GlgA2 [Desulforapulum autotrophicum HRM2]|uniref:Glycogen synthase n=1 Tax=Desulforapulum autotrophicum (strain ATCC 43914 / DSM 3382 / VKM B-1955 / HRM2) TaxID=177437 RepID=C0QJW2_DESAH|nr:glycogen synthase [Desulforapulum autotrophicum]ACN15988.1 GlgA2 [Desulforapulum autotrophicum HRM2]